MKKGFTLIELMVSLAIFAFMTAFLLARYGTFNQSTLLTNLAYDMALTIRSAQSYGLNVQGNNTTSCQTGYSSGNTCFYYPYGVDFNMSYPDSFVLFTDLNNTGKYSSTTAETISVYNMNRGYSIAGLCMVTPGSSTCNSVTDLDVTFKRPNPDAIILGSSATPGSYAQITITANNSTTTVVVQSSGEISVGGN